MTVLPTVVDGLLRREGKFTRVPVTVKSADGQLVPAAIPKVIFVKGDHWYDDSGQPDPASDRGIEASIDMLQEDYPLAGIVAEGLAPYATLSASQEQALLRAVYRGIPVVKTARGDAHGLVRLNAANLFIEGNNLTATKARLLLTAAIMKLGALPHARSRASNESGARCDQKADRGVSTDFSNPLTLATAASWMTATALSVPSVAL